MIGRSIRQLVVIKRPSIKFKTARYFSVIETEVFSKEIIKDIDEEEEYTKLAAWKGRKLKSEVQYHPIRSILDYCPGCGAKTQSKDGTKV